MQQRPTLECREQIVPAKTKTKKSTFLDHNKEIVTTYLKIENTSWSSVFSLRPPDISHLGISFSFQ